MKKSFTRKPKQQLGGGTGRRKRSETNVETQKALKQSLFFQAASEARMRDTERALKEDYVALKAEVQRRKDLTEKLLRLEALRKQDVKKPTPRS